jgi:outer membrane usher protein FimD/PapC
MKNASKYTSIGLLFVGFNVYANVNNTLSFDLDFLQGSKETPKVFRSTSGIVEGHYFSNVIINNKSVGKRNFTITKKEEVEDKLCLSKSFISDLDIKFTPQIEDLYNTHSCIDFDNMEYASVKFNLSNQTLNISIPQRYLSTTKEKTYDYGINGIRIGYSLRATANNSGDESVFGNFNSKLNINKWVVNTDFTGSWVNNGTETNLANLYAQRVLPSLEADFSIGKKYSGNNILGSFSYGGVGLKTNNHINRMKTNYIPHISGVVNSSVHVTVKQNDRIIYAETIPSGPYLINDFSIHGFGDLIVEIKGDNGYLERRKYPIITLPSLLRSTSFDYSIAIGKRFNGSGVDGLFDSERNFIFTEGKYGFDGYTLEGSVIVDEKFKGIGAGATFYLGRIGSLAIEGGYSHANYNNSPTLTGSSVGLKYAYHLTSNTTLQLAAYKYQDKDYTIYNNFNPEDNKKENNKQKGRFELLMSHNYGKVHANLMFWQQTYWGSNEHDIGINSSINSYFFDKVSIGLNASYGDNRGRENYSAGLSVSIPLSYDETHHYLMASVSSSKHSDTVYSTNASGQLSDRVSYSMNINDSGINLNSSYLFDKVNMSTGISYHDGNSLFSAGISGGIAWTNPSGIIAYRHRADTVALIDSSGVDGLSINGAVTNDQGFALVSVSPYRDNNINIDLEALPINIEVDHRQHTVIPVEHAIVLNKIKTRKVFRYIIKIKDKYGRIITSGDVESDDMVVGSLSPNGMAVLSNSEQIKNAYLIIDKEHNKCKINLSKIKPNERKVYEVVCQ